MATSYFGNNLTDLQRGVSVAEEIDARKRIVAQQMAAQLAAERIRAQLEQQRLAQQGQYQQGQLGVANKQADADSAMAAAELLFNQNKQASDVSLAQERNRLFGREIDARYPGEGPRLGEQRLKNEQAERDAVRLVEEHNNAAMAAAARFNAQLQSRINATKLSLDTTREQEAGAYFGLGSNSGAKAKMDSALKRSETAGWPVETQAMLDALSKDPDAPKVIFDGKQFLPKTMRFTPTGAGAATSTTSGGGDGLQQLFGAQAGTATVPAPAGDVFVPGISLMPITPENTVTNDNMVYQVRASDGSVWNATGAQFRAIKQRDPGATIIPPPASARTPSPAASARALMNDAQRSGLAWDFGSAY